MNTPNRTLKRLLRIAFFPYFLFRRDSIIAFRRRRAMERDYAKLQQEIEAGIELAHSVRDFTTARRLAGLRCKMDIQKQIRELGAAG